MRSISIRVCVWFVAFVLASYWWPQSASAQQGEEAYTAMLIASEGLAGQTAGRIVVRITAHTTVAEKNDLKSAFQKSQDDGLNLLRTMSKGYINIEGQQGRKIMAVFTRDLKDGSELVIVGEHVVSKLEKLRDVKPEDHPLAVIHLRFDSGGDPVKGEVFPAVKVSVTPDGFVDVQTDNANKIMMYELKRR